jgi:hypothetical protein
VSSWQLVVGGGEQVIFKYECNWQNMGMGSVKHSFDFVVEGLVVEVVDFDGLEVLFGVEVALGDEEGLSEYEFLGGEGVTLILASS